MSKATSSAIRYRHVGLNDTLGQTRWIDSPQASFFSMYILPLQATSFHRCVCADVPADPVPARCRLNGVLAVVTVGFRLLYSIVSNGNGFGGSSCLMSLIHHVARVSLFQTINPERV